MISSFFGVILISFILLLSMSILLFIFFSFSINSLGKLITGLLVSSSLLSSLTSFNLLFSLLFCSKSSFGKGISSFGFSSILGGGVKTLKLNLICASLGA